MKVINASGWQSQLKGTVMLYSARHIPTDREFAHPKHQRGAFAWVRFDPEVHEILAIRDHFGFEPLYYTYQNGVFIFGSSIPDILKHLPERPPFAAHMTAECFSFSSNVLFAPYHSETFYQGVYRLDPGSRLRLHEGKITVTPYWTLDPEASSLHYLSDQDYLDHFSFLLEDAVQFHAKQSLSLAAEFSGGLDSSAIVTACHTLQLKPALFSHVAEPDSSEVDDMAYAETLAAHLKWPEIQRIAAEDFDPIAVFDYCAQIFGGGAPYIFFMMAQNIHHAVAKEGFTTLLSGFGGDQCASGHVADSGYYRELFRARQFQLAKTEFLKTLQINQKPTLSSLRLFLHLLSFSHPWARAGIHQLKHWKHQLQGGKQDFQKPQFPLFKSVRHHEYELLQGQYCHEVRMRIEYSAVLAKSMGFEYAYPLLDPALVEFCFYLPHTQKKRDGVNRYLIRRYLAQHSPETVYGKHQKIGSIVPATLSKCEKLYRAGHFQSAFSELPFAAHRQENLPERFKLFECIQAYMFKTVESSSEASSNKASSLANTSS